MRIANNMMVSSFLRNTNRNLERINKVNNQITSGKNYQKISDNPKQINKLLNLKNQQKDITQYGDNIDYALSSLETTDLALERLNTSTQKIRDLMISAGDVSFGSDEYKSIKTEINERVKEISEILNSKSDGVYIFGGTKNDSSPVNYVQSNQLNNSLYFSGKDGQILDFKSNDFDVLNQLNNMQKQSLTEISDGVYVESGVSAIDIMISNRGQPNEINFMNTLNDLVNKLENGEDLSSCLKSTLSEVDSFSGNLNQIRTLIGSRQNRLESTKSQNEEFNENLKELISSIEDVDYVEKSIEISSLQTMYSAGLQASSYILQTSLLDFIK